jgi:hypothetical protein
LAFIYAYTHVLGRPPAEADLQRHFGVSPLSVHQMVLTLERTGLIDESPESLAASTCWLLPNCSRSYVDPISTDQNCVRTQDLHRVNRQPAYNCEKENRGALRAEDGFFRYLDG